PVVVTGSQIPLQDDTTDAKRNIVDACIVAASGYAGVMVVFGGKIIRGSRASKVYSGAIEAFRSINYPDIGFASDQRIHFFREYIPPPPVDRPVLYDHVCPQVILLKIIPGVGGEVLDLIEERAYRGVVIESIGKGGLPTSHPNLLDRVKNLVDQGIPVAVTTQCTYQGTNLEVYKNGRETLETGVIPTYDMSIEAVVTKMMWTLGKTDRMPVIRKMMLHNYAGELNYEAENGNGVLSA
ncbi:MAG TPA: L-asparaginase 1, partial [Sediminispirochaeta sp.]|nr:L-asparaginase 1 [Sediminispirochaeta sp.]